MSTGALFHAVFYLPESAEGRTIYRRRLRLARFSAWIVKMIILVCGVLTGHRQSANVEIAAPGCLARATTRMCRTKGGGCVRRLVQVAGMLSCLLVAPFARATSTTRVWSAQECVAAFSSQADSDAVDQYDIYGRLTSSAGWSYSAQKVQFCPVESDSVLTPAAAATLVVSGNVAGVDVGCGGSQLLFTCRTYYDGSGGSCSVDDPANYDCEASQPPRVYHASLDLTAWSGGGVTDTYFFIVRAIFKATSNPSGSLPAQELWEYHVCWGDTC